MAFRVTTPAGSWARTTRESLAAVSLMEDPTPPLASPVEGLLPPEAPTLQIRPLQRDERAWVEQRIEQVFGGSIVVARGVPYEPARLPGRVAVLGEQRVGLVTWHVHSHDWEVVSLDAIHSNQGIGTALMDEVEATAQRLGARRIWFVVTNDNIKALRFYQKRGYRIVAVHRDAVDETRRLKPSLPLTGYDQIPIHDEIELEKRFSKNKESRPPASTLF